MREFAFGFGDCVRGNSPMPQMLEDINEGVRMRVRRLWEWKQSNDYNWVALLACPQDIKTVIFYIGSLEVDNCTVDKPFFRD